MKDVSTSLKSNFTLFSATFISYIKVSSLTSLKHFPILIVMCLLASESGISLRALINFKAETSENSYYIKKFLINLL